MRFLCNTQFALALLALHMLARGWMLADGLQTEAAGISSPSSEGIRITRWGAEDGLPQNTVTSLLQSHDGYLWLGTRYGLVRYDGLRFTTYQAVLGDLTGSNDCHGLAEDSQGRLWIQTAAGLIVRVNGRFAMVLVAGGWSGRGIEQIASRKEGGIWVTTPTGIYAIDETNTHPRLIVAPPSGQAFGSVSPADGGDLWVRTFEHDLREMPLWWRLDAATSRLTSCKDSLGEVADRCLYVHTSRSGRTWIVKRHELFWRDGTNWQAASASQAWGDRQIKSVVDASDGSLWVLSEGAREVHRVRDGIVSFTEADGVHGGSDVRALLADREGNVWLGTGSDGLVRLQNRRIFSMLIPGQTGADEVHSVCPGARGRIWLAQPNGMIRLEGGETRKLSYNPPELGGRALKQRFNVVLEARDGNVWAGFVAGGLLHLEDGNFQKVKSAHGLFSSNWDVNTLFEDMEGRLWVGTTRGLLRQTGGVNFDRVISSTMLKDADIRGIVQAPDGAVWVGSGGHGLVRFSGSVVTEFGPNQGLLSAQAWPLLAETNGAIWVGTPAGLNRIHNGLISVVSDKQGLFDNLAYCLLEDKRGRYWSFGNRGIWRVRKDEINAVADGRAEMLHCVRFGTSDGMASIEGNGDQQPNAAHMPNGELWFPTTRGVVRVSPETLHDNESVPLVSIEEVRVDGQLVFYDGQAISATPLKLAPGSGRVFEVRYTANTFIDSERARFRFRLVGHDTDWREADTSRTTSYTNLRPGPHRFQVKACNSHGYWNEVPAEFAFELLPHFYESWAFHVVALLACVAAVLGLHTRRVRALHRVQLQRQRQAMDRERSRIAKDLHDELGGNLTGHAFKLANLATQLSAGHPSVYSVEELAGEARNFTEQLRQVVWIVDSERDTLEDLAAYLCQYVPQFLEDAGLRCRLDVPADLDESFLSAEARHQLLLIVKEALHNAVRHAKATEVGLEIRTQLGELTVAIADDGCGLPPDFDPSESAGQGFLSMHERAAVLGARIDIANRPSGGIRVAFVIRTAQDESPSK